MRGVSVELASAAKSAGCDLGFDFSTVSNCPFLEDVRDWLLYSKGVFVSVRMSSRAASGLFFWELFFGGVRADYSGVSFFASLEDALAAGLLEACRLLKK